MIIWTRWQIQFYRSSTYIESIKWSTAEIASPFRVPTPQWKQGKWWKVIPHRETQEIKKFWKITWNLKIYREIQYQENNRRKNCCVTSMKWRMKFKMVSFCYGNIQGKLKLHRETTGKTQGILFSMVSGNHDVLCCDEL